jgi:hypothetical protein
MRRRIGTKLFHYGSWPTDKPCPILWISSGLDIGRPGVGPERRFLNVTFLGKFRGRVYEKNLYRTDPERVAEAHKGRIYV